MASPRGPTRSRSPARPPGGGRDRPLPVAAEIAVADPDPAVGGRPAVPRDLDRLPAPPSQARMVDLGTRHEEFAALALGKAHEPRTDVDLHPRLVTEERMRAPVAGDLSAAAV